MSDIEKLVERAIGGDTDAYTELYKISRRQVYFTCLGLLKNETDADDLMQETFFTVMVKLPELKDKSSFQSWINRIAVNKCKNFLDKKTDFSYEEKFEETDNEPADEEITLPDEYIENEEKRKIIMNIIMNSLSDVQRQTIILYYYNQMTAAEIAEEMDCPLGTVTYRLSTSRKVIEKEVLKYEEISNECLHAVLPVPFLTMLLNAEEKSEGIRLSLPDIDFSSALQTASNISSAATSAVTSTTLSTAIATVTQALGAKAIAAITAVVVGGGVTAYYISEKFEDAAPTEEYVYNGLLDEDTYFTNSNEKEHNLIFPTEQTTATTEAFTATEETLQIDENTTENTVVTDNITTTASGITTSIYSTTPKTVTSEVTTNIITVTSKKITTTASEVTTGIYETTPKTVTSEVTTNIITDTSEIITTTASKTTATAVTEATTVTEAKEIWQTGYRDLIGSLQNSYYALNDIHGDSTPELIVKETSSSSVIVYKIYTCDENGEPIYKGDVSSTLGVIGTFSDDGQLAYTSFAQHTGTCTYYSIDLSGETVVTEFLGESVLSDGVVYDRSEYFSSFEMTDVSDTSVIDSWMN